MDPGAPFRAVGRAWSTRVDGDVYAEPLVVGGRVIVATENDSVYALALTTGRLLWRTHLGSPVPATRLPCGDVDPAGITSTPVADPATGSLFVVGLVAPLHHELFALSLAGGRLEWSRGIDAPGADPRVQNQRGALTLAAGNVYVPFGGRFGDCGDYHGLVVGAPADGGGPLLVFRVPSQAGAGLWATGGAVVGPRGELWVTTGNSRGGGAFDYGDSVLELTAALHMEAWFAAPDWRLLDHTDQDLGSVTPAILDGGLIFQAGKQGTGYLISRSHPGGVGGQLHAGHVCGGAYGATAYRPPYVYVPCVDGLVAVNVAATSFSVAWRGPRFHAEPPILAGGLVWTVARDAAALVALDPAGGGVRYRFALGRTDHFATPAASAGFVIVGAGNRVTALRGAA